jgi:hypothetical protein
VLGQLALVVEVVLLHPLMPKSHVQVATLLLGDGRHQYVFRLRFTGRYEGSFAGRSGRSVVALGDLRRLRPREMNRVS